MEKETSSSFTKAKKKASVVLKDPHRMSKLLTESREKINNLELDEDEFKGILGTIKTFIRMLRAFRSGAYTEIPWMTILTVVGALIYFITPIDLIPDFIPVAGYLDDFGLILAVFNRFKADINTFQAWEKSNK